MCELGHAANVTRKCGTRGTRCWALRENPGYGDQRAAPKVKTLETRQNRIQAAWSAIRPANARGAPGDLARGKLRLAAHGGSSFPARSVQHPGAQGGQLVAGSSRGAMSRFDDFDYENPGRVLGLKLPAHEPPETKEAKELRIRQECDKRKATLPELLRRYLSVLDNAESDKMRNSLTEALDSFDPDVAAYQAREVYNKVATELITIRNDLVFEAGLQKAYFFVAAVWPASPSRLKGELEGLKAHWRGERKKALASIRQTPSDKQIVPVVIAEAAQGASYPKRAAWLRDSMAEYAITPNYLYTSVEPRGPTPGTINKILRGDFVTEAVLIKLSKSLAAVLHARGEIETYQSVRGRVPND